MHGVGSRRHQVDVGRSHGLELAEYLRQALHGYRLHSGISSLDSPSADLEILAETAAQAASGEEYGPRTLSASEKGFLSCMQAVMGYVNPGVDAAESGFKGAINGASVMAERAFILHGITYGRDKSDPDAGQHNSWRNLRRRACPDTSG
jgi:hypothetical protein